jgi:hypothetical protein
LREERAPGAETKKAGNRRPPSRHRVVALVATAARLVGREKPDALAALRMSDVGVDCAAILRRHWGGLHRSRGTRVGPGAATIAAAPPRAARRVNCLRNPTDGIVMVFLSSVGLDGNHGWWSGWFCQRSCPGIGTGVSGSTVQAASRILSAIAVRRIWRRRRVAAGTCWHMRDRHPSKSRSSSCPRQYRPADAVLLKPSIGLHRPLIAR